MSKKIMLLALTVISAAAVLALPAVASAAEEDIPLHVVPKPEGPKAIDDVGTTNPLLSTVGGTTVECNEFSGNAEFENTTTGHMELTFSGECHDVGSGAPCGTITTTTLPFHLVTLPEKNGVKPPGVLVTGNNGHFATFECKLFFFTLKVEVKGNGVIGTITKPKCGEESTETTIDFNATAHGVQEHKTVAGTPTTEYTLTNNGENAAQDATGKVTLVNKAKLECT